MDTSLQGECNCGAVKFEVLTPIRSIYKCYCTLCQKQSGTASNAATLVQASDFRWVGTTDGIKVWQKNSGFNSHFCVTCGSPVPNVIGDKYMWIPFGLIGSVDAEVAINIFEDTRPQWEDVCVNKIGAKDSVKTVDDLANYLANHTRT